MRSSAIEDFRAEVWRYYKKNGRSELPWRKTTDPYKILVSEVMLQQTQVPRVVEKYKSFIKKFPTVRKLADATLSDVLKEWNGLGYNRRAKYLHDAARVVVHEYKGNMRKALEHPLPGAGPYTRAAVRAFAFNEPHDMIETNIRAAYIYHFFSPPTKHQQGEPLLKDAEIMRIAAVAAKGQDPRTWHWALMDYGAHLKRSGIRNNNRSAHYAKQSKFEGSPRQLRGAILRELHTGAASQQLLHSKTARILLAPALPQHPSASSARRTLAAWARQARGVLAVSEQRLGEALAGLERDGLIKEEKGKWRIA